MIPRHTTILLMDDTNTEVDEEVFGEVLGEKSDITWTVLEASALNGKA